MVDHRRRDRVELAPFVNCHTSSAPTVYSRRIQLPFGRYFCSRPARQSGSSDVDPLRDFSWLSRPTYASKYPPGQGLVLALGQIFHAPWAAVWLSTALLSGLVTWATWAWLEPEWAIAAGLLTAVQLTGGYWTESYWGGSVAATGGALVVGALGRLLRQVASGSALIFGLGLAILPTHAPTKASF